MRIFNANIRQIICFSVQLIGIKDRSGETNGGVLDKRTTLLALSSGQLAEMGKSLNKHPEPRRAQSLFFSTLRDLFHERTEKRLGEGEKTLQAQRKKLSISIF